MMIILKLHQNTMEDGTLNRQEVYWKDDYDVKCPHCGGTYNYTLYLNTESLECEGCKEFFEVGFMAVDLEVVAR